MLIRLFSILRSVRTPFLECFFYICVWICCINRRTGPSRSHFPCVWVCLYRWYSICLVTSFKFCAFILQWFIRRCSYAIKGWIFSFIFDSIRYIAWEYFKSWRMCVKEIRAGWQHQQFSAKVILNCFFFFFLKYECFDFLASSHFLSNRFQQQKTTPSHIAATKFGNE